jgi:hypothetical protein
MKPVKYALSIVGIVTISLALGACRDDSDGRSLSFNKGTYSGKADTAITDAARRSVQDRVHYQSGVDSTGGGGSGNTGSSSSADVRPPGVGDQ